MTAHEDILNEANRIDTGRLAESAQSQPEAIPLPPDSDRSLNSMSQFIRENPGPALLIGAGLAWAMANRERQKSRSLPERWGSRAQHASQVTREKYHEAKAGAAHTMENARQSTSESWSTMRERMHDGQEAVRRRYDLMLAENPLALGACALAAGLAIGLLFPPTPKENEVFGEASDSLMEQARDIVNEARQAAINTLRTQKHSVEDKLLEARDEAKSALEQSAQEAKRAFRQEMESKVEESQKEFE